ncbi:glutathione S-transferase family protein [uncultured Devosia sp.]|uniref:glutathione S-transferase family protein n=1 Tax=uncultured Devosia sp. TaxID=211434 RepID=UPI002611BBD4|nr:glutathione S-transferase family protein [uncultured Devosia sp.]
MLRILGRVTSINVRKAMWAARELGLDYAHEDWGLPNRDPKVPEFMALNPNAKVPVLVEDDFVLWESIAIMLYLNRKAGGDLVPEEARQQGLVMQWVLWQNNEMGSNWAYPLMSIIRKAPGFDDPQKVADNIEAWTGKMNIIEAHLAKSGDFVVGNRFSLADIAITLGLHRWFAIPFDHPPMQACQAYYERMKNRPTAAEWLTDATP